MLQVHGKLRSGMVLAGRYRVTAELGHGGMSRVLLAEDVKLKGKRWAVKETFVGKADDDSLGQTAWRSTLLAEAELLSRLQHPHLPGIVDYYPPDEDGFFYVIMDYIDGETVQRRFERQGRRMRVEQVVHIGQQLCDLLEYLHSLQPDPIVYRDIKPTNLMMDAADRIWLIDFGIARHYKPGQASDTVAIGTVGFAAPEQLEGRQSDPRTDLYGLGALMFYLLSGGQPYSADQPDVLRHLTAFLPSALRSLLERLLRSNPAERFQTAREAGEALRRVLPEQPGPVSVAARPSVQGCRPPLIVAVGALYPGAGATFAALALARLLHEHGVPHAVVELPSPRSELFAVLDGERRAPAGWRSAGDPLAVPWEDGLTRWLPAQAAGGMPWRELATAVDRPMIVVDIGSDWEHPAAQRVLEEATDLVYTVDPLIYKLEQPAVGGVVRLLQQQAGAGKRVHCAANKAVRLAGQAEWLRLLPHPPAVVVPAFEPAAMAAAAWNGRLIHDDPSVRRQLRTALRPWLRSWLTESRVGVAMR